MTPLILAAFQYNTKIFSGQDEVLMILMNAGADINFQDTSGNTALHYGCKNGHKTVVQLLLKR